MIERGSFVLAALAGDFGKPRPALVVQSDLFSLLPTFVVCPLTSTIRGDADLFRVEVAPNDRNGLRQPSQIMIDKVSAVWRDRVRDVIGRADADIMTEVNRALAVFLGLV